MKITDFFSTDFRQYAIYDSYRSIASYVDGMKPSARKILYSVNKLDITPAKKMKVSSLAAKVSDLTEYIHGQVSLEGVIAGLAVDYCGGNNINFLSPEGSFGTRCIQRASASRYIYTCKNDNFDKVFCKEDEAILIQQEFEGSTIEPQFFVPILPVILINGSEGIGNGFAQKILPRKVETIKEVIKDFLQHKKLPERIPPSYEGFQGEIKQEENSNSYRVFGAWRKTGKTTLEIFELPPDFDLEKYINTLNKLEENKVIKNYKDKSVGNNFLFEIDLFDRYFFDPDKASYYDVCNKLKITKGVSENFTCIDEHNQIQEFKSEIEILKSFLKIRLEYYQKRKDYKLDKLNTERTLLQSKMNFIEAVITGKIKVFKELRKNIENSIEELSKKIMIVKQNDSFDYLLNIPIHSFTQEMIDKLAKIIIDNTEKYEALQKQTIKDLYLYDLKTIR